MKAKLHSGDCCGIKIIHGLDNYPDTMKASARKEYTKSKTSFGQHFSTGYSDMMSHNPHAHCDFFNEAAPLETYHERFKRMVAFIKEKRPHGIIEVVLSAYQPNWKPILEEMGFVAAAKAKNSNTDCWITVYLLPY